jgi:altronate dehydratase small subunit
MKKAIQIDEKDNVATVTSNVSSGEIVEVVSHKGTVILRPKAVDAIRFGHKIALADLEKGDRVIKYGETIGLASMSIGVGAWVHTHNAESAAIPTSKSRGRHA